MDPTNLAPLVSGDAPVVTVPTSEDENVVEDLGEDIDEDEEMQDILEKTRSLRPKSENSGKRLCAPVLHS